MRSGPISQFWTRDRTRPDVAEDWPTAHSGPCQWGYSSGSGDGMGILVVPLKPVDDPRSREADSPGNRRHGKKIHGSKAVQKRKPLVGSGRHASALLRSAAFDGVSIWSRISRVRPTVLPGPLRLTGS
jgi:hypothetical protein